MRANSASPDQHNGAPKRSPTYLKQSSKPSSRATRIAFLPGIKHGICHRLPPNNQLMPGCIADESRDREVGASYRLQTICTAIGEIIAAFRPRIK
jgi:hypothetical protein